MINGIRPLLATGCALALSLGALVPVATADQIVYQTETVTICLDQQTGLEVACPTALPNTTLVAPAASYAAPAYNVTEPQVASDYLASDYVATAPIYYGTVAPAYAPYLGYYAGFPRFGSGHFCSNHPTAPHC